MKKTSERESKPYLPHMKPSDLHLPMNTAWRSNGLSKKWCAKNVPYPTTRIIGVCRVEILRCAQTDWALLCRASFRMTRGARLGRIKKQSPAQDVSLDFISRAGFWIRCLGRSDIRKTHGVKPWAKRRLVFFVDRLVVSI